MKRIAFISEHASPLATLGGVDSGGQNVYVAQTALHLAKLGYAVDVFTRCDDARLPEIVNWQPNIRVIHVVAGPQCFVRKEELLALMPAFADWMERFIGKTGVAYSLIHAHFFMSGLVAAQLKARLNLPYVITFHALGKVRMLHQGKADEFPADRLAIEEMLVQDADIVIAECPQDRTDLMQLYQASAEKITIIPCGCNLQQFYPVDRALACEILGLDARKRYVLQLGRMVKRKGVETVIRGFAHYVRLHSTAAHNLELLIVGGEAAEPDPRLTPEIGRLQQIAAEEGIADQVRFTGRRDGERLRYFYSVAEVFATLPWYEPFGITPLEAMACGVPVIGAAVGGVQSTVVHEKTGLLVPPKDPVAFAEALDRLLHNPQERQRFSKNAVRRIRERFTWEKVAHQLDQVYQAVGAAETVALHDGALTQQTEPSSVFREIVYG